jgi:DNA-binding transcriptional LysR family regulator
MKLRHLETFVLVAEELHFGRAATRLRVAQPAVSQTIASLEDELGAKLFDRGHRNVALTPAGEIFLRDARTILGDLDRAAHRARQAASGERGILELGFTAVCALSPISTSITRFIHAHPAVEVRLRQMGTREQVEALKLGRLDIGFSVLPQDDLDLDTRLIEPDTLHVFLASAHPLARVDHVPVADALRHPFLLMSRESEPSMHAAFRRLCHVHDVEPDIVAEIDGLDAMLAFVAAGLAISFAPSTAGRLRLDGVVSRPLTPAIEAGVTAMWRGEELGAAGRRLLVALGGHAVQ